MRNGALILLGLGLHALAPVIQATGPRCSEVVARGERPPRQRQFRPGGGVIRYLSADDGSEVMVTALVQIEGRVLTLRDIVFLRLGDSNFDRPVPIGRARLLALKAELAKSARESGFTHLVLQGERVSGAAGEPGAAHPVYHVIDLQNLVEDSAASR